MTDPTFPSPHAYSSLSLSSLVSVNMKEVTSNRHSRQSQVYPKKRPSPHGITKGHKSPLQPLNGVPRRTPRPSKIAQQQQRQREALRREGIFIEDEYLEEIQHYMHEMEVGLFEWSLVLSGSVTDETPTAVYGIVYSINGSTARDQVAHATMSGRLLS